MADAGRTLGPQERDMGLGCQVPRETLRVTPQRLASHEGTLPAIISPLYFFFFFRPQHWRPAFRPPPSSLLLCQLGMGASSSFGRPPRSGTLPISTLLIAQQVPWRAVLLVAGTRRDRSARAARTCAMEMSDSEVRASRIGISTAFMASPWASARSLQWKADVVRSRRLRRSERRQPY